MASPVARSKPPLVEPGPLHSSSGVVDVAQSICRPADCYGATPGQPSPSHQLVHVLVYCSAEHAHQLCLRPDVFRAAPSVSARGISERILHPDWNLAGSHHREPPPWRTASAPASHCLSQCLLLGAVAELSGFLGTAGRHPGTLLSAQSAQLLRPCALVRTGCAKGGHLP